MKFEKRQELGGHCLAMHKGLSLKYKALKDKRASRTDERCVHSIAKTIHFAMKAGTLDPLSAKTFAWIKNRPTAAELELKMSPEDVSDEFAKKEKQSDKGRISRLKDKVWRLIGQPRETQEASVGAEVFELI